jgi:hypothetical protein
MSGVIDDYLVDPKVSLLDKTRMQAQVLVPVLRALRTELGKDKADAIVKQALRTGRSSCSQQSAMASRAARAANGRRSTACSARSRAGRSSSRFCVMTKRRWTST